MLRAYGQPVLVEEFVAGDECTVGVLGNSLPEAIGAVRVRPKAGPDPDFVYGLEVKRDWERQLVYETPAPLEPAAMERLLSDAVRAFNAIGCRDVARVDFRVRGGIPVFLEVNPLPGLSPAHGDLPLLARGMGIGYGELMRRMLSAAFSRCGLT
jgi:D-alanine-D-alanine ligase